MAQYDACMSMRWQCHKDGGPLGYIQIHKTCFPLSFSARVRYLSLPIKSGKKIQASYRLLESKLYIIGWERK